MTKIVPNDLLNPTEKTIKNWNCSFIAAEGPNILDKLSLEDLAIPYESQYRSRIVLEAGVTDKPLIYGFIGASATFLMIKVTYDSENDPYYQYEEEKYNISYYFENDPIERPLGRILILTGSVDERIPQIYLNNNLDYNVTLDVLHATIDPEYSGVTTTGYGMSNLSDVLFSGLTSGDTLQFDGTYWTNVSGITGGAGSDGTSGSSGTSGVDGQTYGTDGTSGTSGTSGQDGQTYGTDGTSGTSGSSGTSGQDGQTYGTDGTSGTSGTDGTSGRNGTSGTDGDDGTSGTDGDDGTSGTDGVVTGVTSFTNFYFSDDNDTLYVPEITAYGMNLTGLTSSGSTNYIVTDSLGKLYITTVSSVTENVAVDYNGGTRTLHFVGGLYTGYTDS
jgi:hypothetical protein